MSHRVRQYQIGTPVVDGGAGPSDPSGEFTFGLVVVPRYLPPALRPRLGYWAGDPHTAAPDESTEWRAIAPDHFVRNPPPIPPFWAGDLDSSTGPSDPDGDFTFRLALFPNRLDAKRLESPPFLFDGNDLTTPEADSDPDGDFTYRLASYPDSLRQERVPEFPAWTGDVATPPSDSTGEFTFQLSHGPTFLPPKRVFLGEYTGDIHTLGDFVPPASNYQGLLLLGVGS